MRKGAALIRLSARPQSSVSSVRLALRCIAVCAPGRFGRWEQDRLRTTSRSFFISKMAPRIAICCAPCAGLRFYVRYTERLRRLQVMCGGLVPRRSFGCERDSSEIVFRWSHEIPVFGLHRRSGHTPESSPAGSRSGAGRRECPSHSNGRSQSSDSTDIDIPVGSRP
jgi:hypothetical protein